MKNFFKSRTIQGALIAAVVSIAGLFFTGNLNINGIASLVNINYGQQEVSYKIQNSDLDPRNTEGFMQTISPFINRDLSIIVKSTVADPEAQNFSAQVVEYLRREGHDVVYDYCLHRSPLPNGLWYYQSSTTIEIFIGADNGSYNLNPLASPIECQLEVSYYGGIDNLQGVVDDYFAQASLETGINYHPEAKVPEFSGTFSTSSVIRGELCLSSVKDVCLVPCVSVGRGYPIIGYVTKDDCF